MGEKDVVVGLGLVTDLYELTMASSYLRRAMTESATFSLFARKLPPGRGFLVAAGLEDVLRLLADYAFDDTDLAWLAAHGFDAPTIEALAALRFTGDVWAIPEGHVVLADEPLIEVTAPLPEAQLVESIVLNQITYQTALATKAARCRIAARGRASLVDFSLRRTHGIEAGMAAARAAAIAGFVGTSNVEAARRFGIPAVGTMAHSYVQAFATERDAFAAFATDFPDRATFLVDTYDTLTGVRTAVEVADALHLGGHVGVRLDSGDLLALSMQARRILDEAGRRDVTIVASGGLHELDVESLLDDGAPIDMFGIGTKMGVSADAPSLDALRRAQGQRYAGRDLRPCRQAARDRTVEVRDAHRCVTDEEALMTTPTWVVGVDGSDDSRTALAWAVAQATGRDAQIVALCTWLAPILPSNAIGQPALLMDWGHFEAELRRHLDEIVASVRVGDVAVGPEITARVEQGRAARTLIDNSRGAELLVVGTRGRGGLSGVMLGSISRQCATHAVVPVAVVPADAECVPVRRLVVGYDGSPNAREAVAWALHFAPATAQIDVVRAVDLAPWLDQASVRDRFPTEVDTASAEFEAEMNELDPARRARRSLKLQDARQALCEAAHDADLVVLGARGHGRLGAALLGSVSTWMLHAPSHATVIVPAHHQ